MSSHYLNQCWLIVKWTRRKIFQWNHSQNSYISFKKMHFKMSAKLRQFCLGLNVKLKWKYHNPYSKVHGANMWPTWVLSAPDGPHVGPTNLAIREALSLTSSWFVAQIRKSPHITQAYWVTHTGKDELGGGRPLSTTLDWVRILCFNWFLGQFLTASILFFAAFHARKSHGDQLMIPTTVTTLLLTQ